MYIVEKQIAHPEIYNFIHKSKYRGISKLSPFWGTKHILT